MTRALFRAARERGLRLDQLRPDLRPAAADASSPSSDTLAAVVEMLARTASPSIPTRTCRGCAATRRRSIPRTCRTAEPKLRAARRGASTPSPAPGYEPDRHGSLRAARRRARAWPRASGACTATSWATRRARRRDMRRRRRLGHRRRRRRLRAEPQDARAILRGARRRALPDRARLRAERRRPAPPLRHHRADVQLPRRLRAGARALRRGRCATTSRRSSSRWRRRTARCRRPPRHRRRRADGHAARPPVRPQRLHGVRSLPAARTRDGRSFPARSETAIDDHITSADTAVVLFNLGGPDDLASVEPFLVNLFSDREIIELPGRRGAAAGACPRHRQAARTVGPAQLCAHRRRLAAAPADPRARPRRSSSGSTPARATARSACSSRCATRGPRATTRSRRSPPPASAGS